MDDTSEMVCCVRYPHPTMTPGQESYPCEKLAQIEAWIEAAAYDDPGEKNE